MIKKQELLRRLKLAENEIDYLRRARNIDVDNINLSNERNEYVMHFLADKLGYEIKLKDIIKVNGGIKSIATEVEMVEKTSHKLWFNKEAWANAVGSTGMGVPSCCEGPSDLPTATKPKRKYTKRK